MKLKAVLSTLDGLSDAHRELYTEGEDGKFHLDAEDIDSHPSVSGLRSKRDELLRNAAKQKEEMKKFEGIDPEEYQRLKDAAEKGEEEKLTSKGQFETLRKNLETKHTTELATKDGEIGKRDKFIERLLIDNQVDAAMDAVKVLPQYRAAVKALLKERKPRVVVDGEDYRAIFPTDMGDAEIATFVKEWARTDEAAAFLAPTGTSGSGASGSNGNGGHGAKNPWKPETFNLTEQGRLMKEDPALAARLKSAAGVA